MGIAMPMTMGAVTTTGAITDTTVSTTRSGATSHDPRDMDTAATTITAEAGDTTAREGTEKLLGPTH